MRSKRVGVIETEGEGVCDSACLVSLVVVRKGDGWQVFGRRSTRNGVHSLPATHCLIDSPVEYYHQIEGETDHHVCECVGAHEGCVSQPLTQVLSNCAKLDHVRQTGHPPPHCCSYSSILYC